MYQKYNKQKKFGRFFGFFIVIGSGMYHFIKTNYMSLKSQFTPRNLLKFHDYMPTNLKNLLEFVKENDSCDIKNIFSRSDFSMEKEKNFHMYKENLDKLSTSSFKNNINIIQNPFQREIPSHNSIDVIYSSRNNDDIDYQFKNVEKEKETYLIFKKYSGFKKKRYKT